MRGGRVGPGRRRRVSGVRDRRGRRQPHLDVRRRAVPPRRAALLDGRRTLTTSTCATSPRASCSSSAAGVSGRRYILGTPDGNLSHRAVLRSARRRLGKAAPHAAASRRRCSCRARGRCARLHVPLPVHPDELDSSRCYWYSKTDRAMSELGYGRARCARRRGDRGLPARARPARPLRLRPGSRGRRAREAARRAASGASPTSGAASSARAGSREARARSADGSRRRRAAG